MTDVVIVGAKRTAIGSMLGQFTGVPSPALGAAAIEGALAHGGVAPDQVDEVIMGCVLPAGLGQAPARQASRAAGIPEEHVTDIEEEEQVEKFSEFLDSVDPNDFRG